MGASSALAQIRQRILRVPKTPKIPGAAVTAAATVRHAVVHAARATKIPGAAVTAAATVRHAVVHAAQATKIPAALAAAAATLQQTLTRTAQSPAFGVAMIACLVFGGVVGAAAPPFPIQKSTLRDAAITPVAAVTPASTDPTGPMVIIVQHPKTGFHIAAATVSAPPPTVVVNSPGALGIPMMALSAYRNAEKMMAGADPGCGISWNLLAGIGRIESGHANGGATDARGTAVRPIYGPALDGTLPGNEVIVQSGAAGRISYARAMGPMQFLPGTWARYASDGDGDGVADPQNLYDSTLAAARYLCSGGLNLRDQSQVMSAILRYNNSMPYARNVLGWAAAYATGAVPVDLPPVTGPAPPLGDMHLENPEGIGPGLPLNVHGVPSTDPLAQMPLIDLGPSAASPQRPMWPSQPPAPGAPNCTVICIGQQDALPRQQPPWLSPPPADPPSASPKAAPPGPSTSPPSPAGPGASPAADSPAAPGPMPGMDG